MSPSNLATASCSQDLLGAAAASAGAQQAAPPAHGGARSVARLVRRTLRLPAKNQDAAQQSTDETQCYDWSRTQNGFDPAAPAARGCTGARRRRPRSRARRRARQGRGAWRCGWCGHRRVADNDAGSGAEVGAAAGVIAGGRQARKNKQAQEQKAEQTAQANEDAAKAAQQQKVDTFKRGMAACLEARGYSVK
jgi:hypothetical protein